MLLLPSSGIRLCLQTCLVACLVLPSQAVILLTGDNSANQTAPDAARADIFNAVARVCTDTGGGAFGSAVHLRGKYLLTANHVNVNTGTHVTFDGGVTLYERDTAFAPVQIAPNVDLKLIKLVEDPGLNEVKLFDGATGDIPYDIGPPPELVYTTATIVGSGVGRDANDLDGNTVWNWGSGGTIAKRWGINRIEGNETINYQAGSYDALETTLEVGSGDNEAAVVIYDSGCGLFVEHEGEWKLAGIAATLTTISGSNTSTFDAASSDSNYYVRIKSYTADIEAAIPDPTTYAGWKVDHSLYGADANDDADTDGDGIPQLIEFALGGDPRRAGMDILPTRQVTEDGGSDYLELVVTRPVGLQGLSYIPQTDTTLTTWPADSTGIVNASPTPTDNGDGTETLVYRRAAAVSAHDKAFIRLRVQASP